MTYIQVINVFTQARGHLNAKKMTVQVHLPWLKVWSSTYSVFIQINDHLAAIPVNLQRKPKKPSKNIRLLTGIHLYMYSLLTVIVSDEKPFKCDYCDESFKLRVYLTKHIKKHTGEDQIKSKKCTFTLDCTFETKTKSQEKIEKYEPYGTTLPATLYIGLGRYVVISGIPKLYLFLITTESAN